VPVNGGLVVNAEGDELVNVPGDMFGERVG
jgi:hypothetical protein